MQQHKCSFRYNIRYITHMYICTYITYKRWKIVITEVTNVLHLSTCYTSYFELCCCRRNNWIVGYGYIRVVLQVITISPLTLIDVYLYIFRGRLVWIVLPLWQDAYCCCLLKLYKPSNKDWSVPKVLNVVKRTIHRRNQHNLSLSYKWTKYTT